MYWIDASDTHPCIGTAACAGWKLKVQGQKGHSGLPHKAINALHLGYEAVIEIMRQFHESFPAHPKEKDYGFQCPSTMKLTMMEHPPGAINQIPGQATFHGDIRVNPFYNVEEVMKKVSEIAKDVNDKITHLPGRGPQFVYQLGDNKGTFEFTWNDGVNKGIACHIDTHGFRAIDDATRAVVGESIPYSIGGSLPLVFELQQEGFDLQIAGYGFSARYHGINEFCNINDMEKGYMIFQKIILNLDAVLSKTSEQK